MRKRFYILIVAVCLLVGSGVSGRTQKGPNGACRDECENDFNACLAAGTSYHQCAGDLRRCRKACH
jgi:hypothetical protein